MTELLEPDDQAIRVCFVTTGLGVGGAEAMLIKLIRRLDRRVVTPSVICLTAEKEMGRHIREAGVKLTCLNIPEGKWSVTGLFGVARALRAAKPDVVQGWMYHGNLASTLGTWLSGLGKPVVWGIRGTHTQLAAETISTGLTIALGGLLSHMAAIVINNSRWSAEKHHKELYYSLRNVRIVPNGFDTDVFRPHPKARGVLLRTLSIPEGALMVGHAARLHPMKDHVSLLRAAAMIRAKRDDVYFILMGNGVDETSWVADLADELGVRDACRFLGPIEDVASILPGLDVVTLTSAFGEGFPNVIGEAMACGIPCVVTDVGDSRWLVDDTGLCVQPGNVAAVANAWSRLIEIGERGRAELGAKARQRIIECFSIEKVAQQYEVLYRDTAHFSGVH